MSARTSITEDDDFVCLISDVRNYGTFMGTLVSRLADPRCRGSSLSRDGVYISILSSQDEIDALVYASEKARDASRYLYRRLNDHLELEDAGAERAVAP